jgi:hypothetical protein
MTSYYDGQGMVSVWAGTEVAVSFGEDGSVTGLARWWKAS